MFELNKITSLQAGTIYMVIIGFFLAALVGISLGLIGSGGSILTVPILVYIMGVDPVIATAYSLFIVGSTALVGGINNAIKKRVDFKTVFIFGIPSIATVYITRLWIVPMIPSVVTNVGDFVITKGIALMILFAVVMIVASISMIRSGRNGDDKDEIPHYNFLLILIAGISVGILAGLVGAGGGFLIIPSLVFFAHLPMKRAVGTSLIIIAINSLIGFTGDLQGDQVIDWNLLATFTSAAVIGILMGIVLSKRVHGEKLKSAFGWFVLVMGIYILLKETLLS